LRSRKGKSRHSRKRIAGHNQPIINLTESGHSAAFWTGSRRREQLNRVDCGAGCAADAY
jgi:hypothetical protein